MLRSCVTLFFSVDGTVKVLYSNGAETVWMPEAKRVTVCVSSQVGCSLNCAFCATGAMSKKNLRNLRAEDIVGQYAALQREFPEKKITNIVFMGMGEPLLNFRNVSAAVRVLTDPCGPGLAPRRVTVSTSGIPGNMGRVGSELGVSLAVSLHAASDSLRNELVPLNRTYNIQAVMEGVDNYCRSGLGVDSDSRRARKRRVTFEWCLLRGVNDTEACVKDVSRLLGKVSPRPLLNIIPFNAWDGSDFQAPSRSDTESFAQRLRERGVLATVRYSRGSDVAAACGQLQRDS